MRRGHTKRRTKELFSYTRYLVKRRGVTWRRRACVRAGTTEGVESYPCDKKARPKKRGQEQTEQRETTLSRRRCWGGVTGATMQQGKDDSEKEKITTDKKRGGTNTR